MNTGLSFEFILRAARSYVEKAHADYMALRDGMGNGYKPNHRLDTPWLALSALSADSGAIQWFDGWAGDEDSAPVVAANWNLINDFADAAIHGSSSEDRELVPGGDVMERLFDILERAGYDCQWYDEISTCGSCYRAIRTQPDSYGWQPEYAVGDGEITCSSCMEDAWGDKLAALAAEQGDLQVADVDPSEYGYVAVRACQFGWDGWHKEEKLRRDMRDHDYFLQVVDGRQFGCSMLVWVHGDDVENLPEQIEGDVGDLLERWL